ncbi:MAG: HNH endonuclease domain-containing protein [Candidatus Micrarchaeaceae archaeon]
MAEDVNIQKIPEQLTERIKEFNSAFKLGIDLGTKTGGVALVKDNNVLFAKTFLDFHNETLKERRERRRNRRSRLAKKKRIARLRSWVLRQKVAGKQLPDPYDLKIKNMVLSKLLKEKGISGEDKKNVSNWSEVVIKGYDTSPEAFVKALTLIFKKRGQLYEEMADHIKDMTDEQLKSYIESLKVITNEAKDALIEEINLRQSIAENGRLIRTYSTLQEKIKEIADESEHSKSKAKDRKQREAEIKQLVEAFCKANNIDDKTCQKWISDLAGLLNKPVRKARFLNRIVIRCNICDKITPKKSRKDIRPLLYGLAVINFIKAGRLEPNEDLKKEFNTLYDEAGYIRQKIINNEKMSDEEKKDKRAILNRLKKYINKDLREYEKKRATDKQKEMLDQIKSLLFDKLTGRSKYCKKHLEEQANGIDIEKGYHGQLHKRYGRNFAQQNHDKRVINLIEQLFFNENETLANEIKNNDIRYITIEAPKPNTKRTKKGEVTKKDTRTIKEKLFEEQVGEQGTICIYTGQSLSKDEIEKYEKDHIFPESRGGPSIRDNLVLTTKEINVEKGDRTPWEWLHEDSSKWEAFKSRVEMLYKKGRITERKKELLLNKSNEFPGDNPTELARVSARINSFILEINKMLKKHGLPEAQTLFERGKPIVQVVRGEETQKLRRQWHAENEGFIPLKDRAYSFNHAEDAAIAASMPPNFWRLQIYRYKWSFPDGKERPDFALPDIAPHWSAFVESRKEPIICVLGKTKYSWKRSIINETIYKPFNERSYYKSINKRDLKSASKAIKDEVPLKELNEHKMSEKYNYYHITYNNKRYLIKAPKGGSSILVKPHDGPQKLLEISPKYEFVLLGESDGKIKKIYKPIWPILKMYESGVIKDIKDNELKKNVELYYEFFKDKKNVLSSYKKLYLHDIVYLDTKKHKGYFITTKFSSKQGVKALPESKVKIMYAYNGGQSEGEDVKGEKKESNEITLGNEDLAYIIKHGVVYRSGLRLRI